MAVEGMVAAYPIDILAFQGLEEVSELVTVSGDSNALKELNDFVLCGVRMVKTEKQVRGKILHIRHTSGSRRESNCIWKEFKRRWHLYLV